MMLLPVQGLSRNCREGPLSGALAGNLPKNLQTPCPPWKLRRGAVWSMGRNSGVLKMGSRARDFYAPLPGGALSIAASAQWALACSSLRPHLCVLLVVAVSPTLVFWLPGFAQTSFWLCGFCTTCETEARF